MSRGKKRNIFAVRSVTLPSTHTSHLSDLVQYFRASRAPVIGDALLDSYLEGEASRLSRDRPISVVRKTTEQRIPGGAANVVANLRALEAHVTFLSIIGHDSAGALLRTTLQERGLMISGFLKIPLLVRRISSRTNTLPKW